MPSDTSHAADRFVVGLDLQPTGEGAVEYAKWLYDSTAEPEPPHFIGIHVLENNYLYSILRGHHLDEVIKAARKEVLDDIDGVRASRAFFGLHVVQSQSAERGLADACRAQGAQALVVSRHAPRKGRRLVRLGRVPRRLLQRVEVPTFIVPSDLTADTVGSGPVIAAVDMHDGCVAAARYAAWIAQRLGRPFVVAHVRATVDHYGARYVPPDSLEGLAKVDLEDAQHALDRWLNKHDLKPNEQLTLSGSVVDELIGLVDSTNACLLAFGAMSTRRDWEQFLDGTLGSELAAASSCAVVSVPAAS